MHKKTIYFQTEGTNKNGLNYHSDQCQPSDPEFKKFAHELLDEFLEAFDRDPDTAKLEFYKCSVIHN